MVKKIFTYLLLFLFGFFGYKGLSIAYNSFFNKASNQIKEDLSVNLKGNKKIFLDLYTQL